MPPDIAAPDAAIAAARAELDRLWARGTAFLGCRVAIMGGVDVKRPKNRRDRNGQGELDQ